MEIVRPASFRLVSLLLAVSLATVMLHAADEDQAARDLRRAREHYRQAEYEAAREILARLLDEAPENVETRYLAGLVELSAGELEPAIDLLEDAGSQGVVDAYFYLGFALLELDDRPAARRSLEHFLAVAAEGSPLRPRARKLLDRLDSGEWR